MNKFHVAEMKIAMIAAITIFGFLFFFVLLRFAASSNSLLFVVPDYHSSFILRDELRRLGWRCDVYIPYWYPRKLLYADDGIEFVRPSTMVMLRIKNLSWLICFFLRYRNFVIYSAATIMPLPLGSMIERIMGDGFQMDLTLARLTGKKLLYIPSGCNAVETKENFSKIDDGIICRNCGWAESSCNDEKNKKRFASIRRYFHSCHSYSGFESSQYKATPFSCKSFDLDLWSPHLKVPEKYILPRTGKIRIMHCFFNVDREYNGKNIKGSPHIYNATERLINEGYAVEYFYVTDIPSREMRYYQAQADIIVEQLIFGWWGSTGAESMCLGKPTVCYLRQAWKEKFITDFPEFEIEPIVEANLENIYEVLKKLVEDKLYRENAGRRARQFAEAHFDVKKNAIELVNRFAGL